jgi:hypothetical protein
MINIRLSEKEWAILREMAYSLVKNIEPIGDGYYSVGDTLIDREVELLKKLSE